MLRERIRHGTAPKRGLTKVPAPGHDVEVVIQANTLVNLRRALVERVFCVETPEGLRKPPRAQAGVFVKRMGHYLPLLQRRIGAILRLSYDEFVEACPSHTRTRYRQAVVSLFSEAVSRRDAFMRSFLKAEKVVLSASKPDPAARIIQPRDPRYNVEVGRFLRPLEHRVYRAIGKLYGDLTVFKGVNADEAGEAMRRKWERYQEPVAIGLDASRFDQHVGQQALEFEHSLYVRCFRGGEKRELQRLLSWQLHNYGRASASDGSIDYDVQGCRMSGDMNTSLGNCLLMCLMVHSYMTSLDIPDFSLANNGDDCVVIFERKYLERLTHLREWFLEMGFTMKVEEPVYLLEHVEFCQAHPVRIGEKYRMVRNLVPGLAKDLTTKEPVRTQKEAMSWLASVGAGGVKLCSGVPVYQALFVRYLQLSAGTKANSRTHGGSNTLKYWAMRMEHSASPVSEATRYSFYLAFGILPAMQHELETMYSKLSIDLGHVRTVIATPALTPNFIAPLHPTW